MESLSQPQGICLQCLRESVKLFLVLHDICFKPLSPHLTGILFLWPRPPCTGEVWRVYQSSPVQQSMYVVFYLNINMDVHSFLHFRSLQFISNPSI